MRCEDTKICSLTPVSVRRRCAAQGCAGALVARRRDDEMRRDGLRMQQRRWCERLLASRARRKRAGSMAGARAAAGAAAAAAATAGSMSPRAAECATRDQRAAVRVDSACYVFLVHF